MTVRRFLTKPVVLIVAVFLLLNLFGLDRSPKVWFDEVVLNDPAKELALHGVLRSSVFYGHSGFEKAYFWQPPGQPLITAVVYKVFGFGIWQTRVPVVIFGAGVLVVLYWLTKTMFNSKKAGALAALIFAVDPQFLKTVRAARMDAQCLIFALLGVVFFVYAYQFREKRSLLIGVSGLMVGISAMTHPVGLAWFTAILCLFLITHRLWRTEHVVLFVLLAALPMAVWLGYASKYPDLFVQQFFRHGQAHLATGSVLTRSYNEFRRILFNYRQVPLLLLLYILSLVTIFVRGHSVQVKVLVTLFFVLFVFDALVMTKMVGFYYLHPIAVLAIAFGGSYSSFITIDWLTVHRTKVVAALLLVLLGIGNAFAVGTAARLVALTYWWHARDYQAQVVSPIRKYVPPGSVVRGVPKVWYAVDGGGSSLRLLDDPNPRKQDFIIVEPGGYPRVPAGFHKVADIGEPLPALPFGIKVAAGDYVLGIWQSDFR